MITDVSVSGGGSVFTATISNGSAGQVWEAVREDYATSLSCSPFSGSVTAGASSTATVTCTLPSSLPCCEIATMRFDLKASAAGPVLSSNRKSVKLQGSCTGTICPPCTGTLCPFIKIPWDRYVIIEKWPRICPKCPSPCLSCPFEWKTPIPDGFERALIRLSPALSGEGQPGPSEKEVETLRLEGTDFKENGSWVKDSITGQSLKLIEYRVGAVPRVRVTDGKQVSQEIRIEDRMEGRENEEVGLYKTLFSIAAVLLLTCLVAVGVLVRRLSTSNRPS